MALPEMAFPTVGFPQWLIPRCSTSRLECPPCLPPLNIHQSRTIQSWVENPSLQPRNILCEHFVLRVYCTYLLTAYKHGIFTMVINEVKTFMYPYKDHPKI